MAVPPWAPMLLGKKGLARRQPVAILRAVYGSQVSLGASVSHCAEVKQLPCNMVVIFASHITSSSLYCMASRKTAKY